MKLARTLSLCKQMKGKFILVVVSTHRSELLKRLEFGRISGNDTHSRSVRMYKDMISAICNYRQRKGNGI
jgi:hypothetical protein